MKRLNKRTELLHTSWYHFVSCTPGQWLNILEEDAHNWEGVILCKFGCTTDEIGIRLKKREVQPEMLCFPVECIKGKL
ncbi:hypothetical protein Pcac1_g24899 [Phytophthora cactorum]|nr:hypothetical protein Pcac1_g24899 [Phytophthora cactorum]